MKKTLILVGLMSLASVFAAPSFTYVKDAAMNGMMMAMGSTDNIELSTAPTLKLESRNVTTKQATFFYSSTNVVSDAQTAYEFYQGALMEHGWKTSDHMMAGNTMSKDTMGKDAMAKDAMAGDTMAKDAMSGDAMAKDAMAGKGDAMMGKNDSAMMMAKGIFETTLTQGDHTILIKVQPNGNRVEVDLTLM